MISTIIAGGLNGVEAYLAEVEVDISTGLPGFSMVGSLNGEVREARERVQVALRNAGFDHAPMKITVNLAPADLRKEGTAYDLPIAVGMLQSLGYFPASRTEGILFAGELGLDGEVKGVRGILPIVREAAGQGIKSCVVPGENAMEGAVIPGITVRGVENIGQLVRFLKAGGECGGEEILPASRVDGEKYFAENPGEETLDFREVCGQEGAKRAAEIAAAGFHNLLMIGPPGTGKSMIAKRIPGILPPLSLEESLEVSSVYSVAGQLQKFHPLMRKRPFQSPHHTITQAALTGGSSMPRPGVISLAHRGVLFLDELAEFARPSLDSLRQPLEDHEVHLARMYGNVTYPADFMLVCAMNPCPCGFYPDRGRCTCTESEIRKYQGRISGPILDRIDLCAEVLPMDIKKLSGTGKTSGGLGGESSAAIRRRVMAAQKKQQERFQEVYGSQEVYRSQGNQENNSRGNASLLRGRRLFFNSDIPAGDMEKFCHLGRKQQELMERAYLSMHLSARSYHRILRVARTIADLAGEEDILEEHILEAMCYRMADHIYWRREGSNETTGL